MEIEFEIVPSDAMADRFFSPECAAAPPSDPGFSKAHGNDSEHPSRKCPSLGQCSSQDLQAADFSACPSSQGLCNYQAAGELGVPPEMF